MNHKLTPLAEKYHIKRHRQKVWHKVVGALGCLVVFCTTYALILPALTMEKEAFCGVEEHTHESACYAPVSASRQPICTAESLGIHQHSAGCRAADGSIVCGQADFIAHIHSDECFLEDGTLWCPLEEVTTHTHGEGCYAPLDPGHTHTEACYTQQQGALVCTEPEVPGHTHGSTCYLLVPGELVCSLPENEAHTHTETCYATIQQLTCTLPEQPGHAHGDDCYSHEQVLSCTQEEKEPSAPQLVCTMRELTLHQHSGECFNAEGIPVCGKLQLTEHMHGDECFLTQKATEQEPQLVCQLNEHKHQLICFSDPTADVESPADWEATLPQLTGVWADDLLAVANSQLGYEESVKNYTVLSDGATMLGYSRYGDWYGSRYGDWCAMFVSFCLHYADIPESHMPYDANCGTWVDTLKANDRFRTPDEYTPTPGDIIFFDYNNTAQADHVGIVLSVDSENGKLTAIEGNHTRTVETFKYSLSENDILGYGMLLSEELPVTTLTALIYTDASYTTPADDPTVITLTGAIPKDAQVRAYPVSMDPEHQALCAYDIAIFLPDGTVFEPSAQDAVTVSIQTPKLDSSQVMDVFYVPQDGTPELIPSVTEDDTISFDTDHFSVYMVRAAAVTSVNSQTALAAAIAEGKTLIQLANDMGVYIDSAEGDSYGYVDGPLTVPANTDIILDLNGKKLWQHGTDALFSIPATSSLTIIDSRSTEEAVQVVQSPDSLIANPATFQTVEGTPDQLELTYYITTSNLYDPAADAEKATLGATYEQLEKHVVSAPGGIYANNQTVFRVNGGTLNIQSGMIYSGTGRAINQSSGTTNLNGGYIFGFTRSSDNGGAVRTTGGTLNLSGGVLAGNQASNGGAVFAENTTVNMTGGVISGNTSTNGGISDEGATHYGGGGIRLQQSPTTISGGYITNNLANAAGYFDGGGGILACGTMELKLQGGYITGNQATNGAGIRTNWKNAVSLTMSGGYVCRNLALSAEGGGISVNMGGTGIFTGGYINNNVTNTANHWGGGGLFGATGSTLYIRNVLITENSAGGFGGGVGGCSTGRIYICVREGGAVYQNSAEGENISGSTSIKPEDHVYAANNEVFMSNGYQDYFCALNSIVDGAMLGGHAANWTGSADGAVVRAGKDDTLVASYVMGLTSAPTEQGKEAAVSLAKVYMNGNHSNTHGGAILCNGYMIIGETDHIELGARIELNATKSFLGSDSVALAMEDGQFTFEVIDAQTGAVLATASNDTTGTINFKERLPFLYEGTFVYYIREVPGDDPTIAFDTTTYRLTVQVKAETQPFDDVLVNGDTITIQKTQYLLDAITIDKRNGEGDWERVSHNDNPSNSDSSAVTLSLTSSATFTNVDRKKISVHVEKVWEDQTPDLRPDYVTAYLLRNGERYQTATLSESNGWRYTWADLPVVESDGTTYSYSVEEAPIPGYVPEYEFVNTNQAQEQKGYWIPADSIQPGKQYIIVSPDRTQVLFQGPTKRNNDLGTGDKQSVSTTTINAGGTTYTTAIDDALIQDASKFVPTQVTAHSNKRLVLKNSVDIGDGVSCLLAEDNTNDGIRLKGCNSLDYGSGVKYDNGISIQWQWNSGNSWYYIVYENGQFNAVTAQNANDGNKALLYTHTYVGTITSDTTVRITNRRTDEVLYTLDITKRSGINEEVLLSGAEFQLLTPNGDVLSFVMNSSGAYTLAAESTSGATTTLVTSGKGKLVLRGLSAGDYILRETKAPTDHMPIADMPVTLGAADDSGNVSLTLALTIVDRAISYELPETGGPGTYLYTTGGLLLMTAAVILLLYLPSKRRKEDFSSS